MYEGALGSLKSSRDSGDQLAALRAQYDYYLEILGEPEITVADRVRVNTAMTSISMKIVELEGLRREFTGEEKKVLTHEAEFRHFFSKDGVGIDDADED